ncbi:hypothetical protein FACS1894208_10400 [Clostridia bacterium]|nr:hypothetical protein FACS1894208_10400 [Clostridia bacterium]
MFTLTINGNTPEELFANLAKLAAENGGIAPATITQPAPSPFTATPTAQQPPIAPTAPQTTPVFPTTPAAPTVPQPPVAAPVAAATATTATTAPTFPVSSEPAPGVPAAAPTYTLDALARAGATLAQSGKMEQALALLARYGVQTVNQLKPEQYGAFATELRALGAQV